MSHVEYVVNSAIICIVVVPYKNTIRLWKQIPYF